MTIEASDEGTKRLVGKEVYYRQGLKETEHKIEAPLKPDAVYYWSVRTRREDKVSEWAVYDYAVMVGTYCRREGNRPFIFKTPNVSCPLSIVPYH